MLVTPELTLTESADILRWVDARSDLGLYADPEAAALEARFDAELGPHGRRWMYHRMLGSPDLIRDYGAPGVPRWERAVLPAFFPLVQPPHRALPRRRRRHRGRFARARAGGLRRGRRAARGRPALPRRRRFSAADLAFAALAAAVVVPPRYGMPLPQPDVLPEPFAGEVRAMREHPAGAFALRLYDQERP